MDDPTDQRPTKPPAQSTALAPGPGTADSKDSWRRGAAVYKLIASNAAASTLQESLENMARYGEVALTAAVNHTDRGSGLSCLHLAARSADRETCQLLISCRADVSSRDSHGQTALAHCIAADNYRVVFFMMSGAGVRDKDGNTPLHLATLYGRPKFYFKLGGDLAHLLTTINARGQTHLHCALMRRPFHAETARAVMWFKYRSLQKIGRETDSDAEATTDLGMLAKDFKGETPLHYAARVVRDDADELSLLAQIVHLCLVENKRAFGITDKRGRNVLHVAAECDHHHVARLLLSRRNVSGSREFADTSWTTARDARGMAPLHVAVAHNSLRTLRVLLNARGVEINVRSGSGGPNGWTPLAHAAKRGHIVAAQYLFAAGARPTQLSLSAGAPPTEIDIALASGHRHLAAMMLANATDRGTLSAMIGQLEQAVARRGQGPSLRRRPLCSCVIS